MKKTLKLAGTHMVDTENPSFSLLPENGVSVEMETSLWIPIGSRGPV